MIEIPNAPEGAKEAGQRLWTAVLSRYELDEHEMTLLVQACRTADVCADLQRYIDSNGLMVSGSKSRSGGGRLRAAVAELRQQRLALARLVVALRVPIGEQEEASPRSGARRPQRRGVRGFYTIPGGREGAS